MWSLGEQSVPLVAKRATSRDTSGVRTAISSGGLAAKRGSSTFHGPPNLGERSQWSPLPQISLMPRNTLNISTAATRPAATNSR